MNDASPSLVDLYNLKQEYGVDNHYSVSDSNVVVTSNSGEVVNTLSVSDVQKSNPSYESTESAGNTGNDSTTNTGDNLRDRGYSSSTDGYNPSKSNERANTTTSNVVKPAQLNKGEETDSGTGNAEAGAKAGILASDITNYEEPALSYDARIDENHDNSAYWSEHREEQRRMEAEASLERIEELKTIAEGKQEAADTQAEKYKICGNTIGSDTEPDDNSVDLRDSDSNALDSTEKAYGEAAAATQAYLNAIEKYKREYGDLNLENDLDTKQQEAQEQLDAAVDKQYKVRNTSAVMEEVNHNLAQLFGGTTTYHEDGSKTVKDGNTEYHYDKDGNLLSTVERDKDGNILNIHAEEGSALPQIHTEVFDDGSKSITINGIRYNYDTDGKTMLSISKGSNVIAVFNGSKLLPSIADDKEFEKAIQTVLDNLTFDELYDAYKGYSNGIESLQTQYDETAKKLAELQKESSYSTLDTLVKYYHEGKITEEEYARLRAEKVALVGEEAVKKAEDRIAKINEYEEQCQKYASDIAKANNISTSYFVKSYLSLEKNDDFAELSKSRIGHCEIEYENGWEGLYKKYVYYDENGNIIDNPTDSEIAMFFHSEEGQKYYDEFEMSNEVQKYYNAFEYLDDTSVNIINYLNNIGDTEKLADFNEFAFDLANQIHGQQMAEDIKNEIQSYYDKIGKDTVPTNGFLANERVYTEDDAIKDTMALLAANGFIDGLDNFVEGFGNWINGDGKLSADEYKTASVLNYLNETFSSDSLNDKLAKELTTSSYNIGKGLGNLAPSMIISMASGIPILGTVAMGVSVGGNSKEEGLKQGMNSLEANIYGFLTGTTAATLQYFLGGLDPLGSGELSNAIQVYTGLNHFAASLLAEDAEELSEDFVNPLLATVATGGRVPYKDMTLEDAARTFIYTTIETAIANTGSVVVNDINYTLSQDAIIKLQGIDVTSPDIMNDLIDNGILIAEELPDDQLAGVWGGSADPNAPISNNTNPDVFSPDKQQQLAEEINNQRQHSDKNKSGYDEEALAKVDEEYRDSKEFMEQIDFFAERFGLSREETIELLDNKMKELIDSGEFIMRRSTNTAKKILDSGVFRNQFETLRSAGELDLFGRTKVENEKMGVSTDTRDADRPIYGLVVPNLEVAQGFSRINSGKPYGDVIFVFDKDKVIDSTTFTCGDSYVFDGIVSSPANDPQFMGGFDDSLYTYEKFGSYLKSAEDLKESQIPSLFSSDEKYLEIQLHGQESHKLDNVKKILFDGTPDPELVAKIEEKGIPWGMSLY